MEILSYLGSSDFNIKKILKLSYKEYEVTEVYLDPEVNYIADKEIAFGEYNVDASEDDYGIKVVTETAIYIRGEYSETVVEEGIIKEPNTVDAVIGIKSTSDATASASDGSTDELTFKYREESVKYNDYLPNHPETSKDFRIMFRYILKNGFTNITFTPEYAVEESKVEETIEAYKKAITDGYNLAAEDYAEYKSFYNGFSYNYSYETFNGYALLHFDLTMKENGDGIRSKIKAFNESIFDCIEEMYDSKRLTDTLDTYTKLQVICTVVCDNFTYDLSYSGSNPYDASVAKLAVCEQYTAVFNALSKMAGFDVRAQYGTSGGSHVWSRYKYDGVSYNIDSTWCDIKTRTIHRGKGYAYSYYDYNMDYFWLTDDELKTMDPSRTFGKCISN